MSEENLDGFSVPIFRSLTEKVLWLGAPRMLVIANGMVGIFLFFILQMWQIAVLNLILHGFATLFAKGDPLFFDIFLRSRKIKDHYYV